MESSLLAHLSILLPITLVIGIAVATRFGEESAGGITYFLWGVADHWLPVGTLAWLLTFAFVGGTSGALFGFGLLWYTGLFARIYHRPASRGSKSL